MAAKTTPRKRVRDRLLVKLLVVAWPFVIGAVLVGLFFRPAGSETIVKRDVWLPADARITETTGFMIDGMKNVSVDEFRDLGITEPNIFVDKSDVHLRLVYQREAADPEIKGYKAEVTVAEAKIGQTVDKYTVDRKNQAVTVGLVGGYSDHVVWLLYGIFAFIAAMVALVSAIMVYWRSKV